MKNSSQKNEKEKIRIAVSGERGSFSEEAGLKYAQQQKLKNIQIVYRTNMEKALTALDQGEAELVAMPVYNKILGPVMPAMEAMGKHIFIVIGQIRIGINFCLLAKKGMGPKDIKTIAHYLVAGKQCRKFLQKNYPDATENLREDTGLAAEELSKGILGDDTAVIAPKRCAEIYAGLQVIAENIQDNPDNFSDFIIVTKP